MNFGAHVDNAIRPVPARRARMRTDVSATLFLSAPEDYDGGELVVEDTYGTHSVKLPAGDMILYPATSLHRVAPVTRGARIASFFWIQSMVKDDGERTLLFDLDRSIVAARPDARRRARARAADGALSQPRPQMGRGYERAAAARRLARRGADHDAPEELRAAARRRRSARPGWKPRRPAACPKRNCGSAACCWKARASRKTRARRSPVSSARRRAAMPKRATCSAAATRTAGAPRATWRARPNIYRVAAEAGLAWAQYNLGHLLLDGTGVARDRDAAFLWYMRAASRATSAR